MTRIIPRGEGHLYYVDSGEPRGFRAMITPETVRQFPPLDVLEVDSPWEPKDKLPGKGRGAAKNYSVMTVDQLRMLPLPPLKPDCLLLFWKLTSMQHEALEVVDSWGHHPFCFKHPHNRDRMPHGMLKCNCGDGFTPKTELKWRKIRQRGKRHFGMGRIVRATSELCILATRGRIRPAIKSLLDEIGDDAIELEAPMPATDRKLLHSAKPREFYQLIEQILPGAVRGQLFARAPLPGWWQIGKDFGGP